MSAMLPGEQWARLPTLDLVGVERVVVLSTLPDDETLGFSDLLLAARHRGIGTQQMVASGDEESVVEALCRSLAAHERPERTLVCAPWRHDGCSDHQAAGRAASVAAARAGCRLVEYPIRWWDGDGAVIPWDRAHRVDPDQGDLQQLFLVSEIESAAEVFETVHAAAEDPWGVDDLWYEERKRAVTVAALPKPWFSRALEIGCSVGAMTSELSHRCRRLLAIDASASAVHSATRRLSDHPDVEVRQMVIPTQWPEGTFDLVVMSESGYFLTPLQLDTTLELIVGSLTPDGVVAACHWRHPIRGWPLDGEVVHQRMLEAFAEQSIEMLALHLEPDFVVHVFGRDPAVLPNPHATP